VRSLLVVVVALVVGAGIGYAIAERRAAPPTGLAGDPANLADALRAIPVPPVEKGTGQIRGRVLTEQGEPLAGATVRAVRHQPSDEREFEQEQDADIVEEVRQDYLWRVWQRAYTFHASTAEDGTFAFERLPAGAYALRVEADQLEVRPVAGNAWRVRPGATVDFVAQPSIGIEIDIRYADGAPADVAELRIEGVDHPSVISTSWSRESHRRVDVRPGLWKVSAKVKDPPAESEPVLVDTRKAAAEIVLRLRPRRAILGTLRFAGDEFVNGVRVTVEPPGREDEDDESPRRRLYDGGEAWPDRGESYVFADLRPGPHVLRARLEGRLLAERTVAVASGPVRCDLEIPRLDPSWFLRIRALDPDGQPVRDLEVTGERVKPGLTSWSGVPATRLGDGSFLVPHPAHEGDVPEPRRILVEWQGCKRRLEYDPADRSEAEFHFAAPAHLRLRAQSSPNAAQGRVSFALAVEETERWRSILDWRQVAADEETVLGPVESGARTLFVQIDPESGPWIEFAMRRIDLVPGENRLTIEIPALHALHVHCPGLGRGSVVAQRLDMPLLNPASASIGEDGRAAFAMLPAGRYLLHLNTGREVGLVEADVPAKEEVRLEGRPADALRVVVTDPDGTLGALGLKNSDLIVAARGQELGESGLWELVAEKTDGESIGIEILREGRRHRLHVRLADLRAFPEEAGGELVPALR